MIDASTIAILTTVLGILVGVVNILTQVIKKLFNKFPTSLVAFVVSQLVSFASFFTYCSIYCVVFKWYYIFGVIVGGFMVAYAAMFGFDKLKEVIQGWTSHTSGSDKNEKK